MPAVKYITHVSLFKSHCFDFHFPACRSGDLVAESPGPHQIFELLFPHLLMEALKGRGRLAVVGGVGLYCIQESVCVPEGRCAPPLPPGQWGVGLAAAEPGSEQGWELSGSLIPGLAAPFLSVSTE